MASIFETLNAINVNEHTEKKQNLTYLSWAWAWSEVKKVFPEATYTIYERQTEFGAVNYFTDGRTCWVKTGLTINGLEHIEELPVMDFRNNSIPYEAVKSTDVNKAIQRSLTKAAARHGLGLYIYAGEDLPEPEAAAKQEEQQTKKPEPLPEIRQEATATVSTSAAVPAPKKQTEAQKLIANAKRNIEKEFPGFDFRAERQKLIAENLIDGKPSDQMTVDEAAMMIDLMYQRARGCKAS